MSPCSPAAPVARGGGGEGSGGAAAAPGATLRDPARPRPASPVRDPLRRRPGIHKNWGGGGHAYWGIMGMGGGPNFWRDV